MSVVVLSAVWGAAMFGVGYWLGGRDTMEKYEDLLRLQAQVDAQMEALERSVQRMQAKVQRRTHDSHRKP